VAATRLINVTVGEVEIAVETVPAPASELTFGRNAQGRAREAFIRAQEAILEVARSTAEMIDGAAAVGVRPDQVELEFGLRFSAAGGVILAAASDQSSLHVTLTYGSASQSAGQLAPAIPEADVIPVAEAR
jgi:hypothetical protein